MDEDLKSLKTTWQQYMKVKSDEKHDLLLRFLSDFYSFTLKSDGEMPRFSDRQSMCSLLVREIRSDIAHCCTQSTSDGDMEPFVEYFQNERGWLLLYALWKLDIMEVHLARDFASIVISLLRSIELSDHPDEDGSTAGRFLVEGDLPVRVASLKRLERLTPVPSVFDMTVTRRRKKKQRERRRDRVPDDSEEEVEGRKQPNRSVDLRKLQSKVIFDLYLSDETLQDLVSDSERTGRTTRKSGVPRTSAPVPRVSMWTVKCLMLRLLHRVCDDVNNADLLPEVLPGLLAVLSPEADTVFLRLLLRLLLLVGARLAEAGASAVLIGNEAIPRLLAVPGEEGKDAVLLLLACSFLRGVDEESLRLLGAWEDARNGQEMGRLGEKLILAVKNARGGGHHVRSCEVSGRCAVAMLVSQMLKEKNVEVLGRTGACCCMSAADLLIPLINLGPDGVKVAVDIMARDYCAVPALAEICELCSVMGESEERWAALPTLKDFLLHRPAGAPAALRHILVLLRSATTAVVIRLLYDLFLPLLVDARTLLQSPEPPLHLAALCRLVLRLVPLLPSHARKQRLVDQMAEIVPLARYPQLRRHVYSLVETLVIAKQSKVDEERFGPDLAFQLIEFVLSVGDLRQFILSDDESSQSVADNLHENTDIWLTYQRLFFYSEMFRSRFYEKNGFSGAYLLLKVVMRSFQTSPIHQDQYRLFRALIILVFETCKMNKDNYSSYNSEVILLSLTRLANEVIPFDNCDVVTTVMDNVLHSCSCRNGHETADAEPLTLTDLGVNLDNLLSSVFHSSYSDANHLTDDGSASSEDSSQSVYEADNDASSSSSSEEARKEASDAGYLVHPDLVSLLLLVVTSESMCDRSLDNTTYLNLQRRYLTAAADLIETAGGERNMWGLLSVTLDRIECLAEREIHPDLWPLMFAVLRSIVTDGVDVRNLRRIFELMKNKAVPTREVLECLHCLACCVDLGPSTYLRFPVSVHQSDSVTNINSHSVPAISIPLRNQNSCWPAKFSAGFAVSMWLNFCWPASIRQVRYRPTRRPSDKYTLPQEELDNNFLHILSVGHSLTLLEFWCDPSSYFFYFRLVDNSTVIGEAGATVHLQCNAWFHLCVSVQPERTQLIRISISMNGSFVKDITLRHSIYGEGTHAVGSLSMKIGHADTYESKGRKNKTYKLGATNFFCNSIRIPDDVIYLYALGPDWIGSSTKRSDHNYSCLRDFYMRRLVQENQCARVQDTFSRLMVDDKWDCPALSSLSVSISPLDPHRAIYRTASDPGGDTGSNIFRIFKSGSRPSRVIYQATETEFEIDSLPSSSFAVSLQTYGGVRPLIYLVGRTIGESLDASLQATALSVLLTAVNNSPRLKDDFMKVQGGQLLLSVLTHPRCRINSDLFIVLLHHCVSKKLCSLRNGDVRVSAESLAFVMNADFIASVILSWKLWDNLEPQSLQNHLMKALGTLVAGNNRFQSLNIHRLVAVSRLPPRLLQGAAEQWVEVERLPPPAACRHLVELVGESWGSPPSLAIITEVFRTILLLHPDNVTEIVHKPSQFFQALKPWMSGNRRRQTTDSQVVSTDSGALSSCLSLSSTSSLCSVAINGVDHSLGKDLESTRMSAMETEVFRTFFEKVMNEEVSDEAPVYSEQEEEKRVMQDLKERLQVEVFENSVVKEEPEKEENEEDEKVPGREPTPDRDEMNLQISSTTRHRTHSKREQKKKAANKMEEQQESLGELLSGLLTLLRNMLEVQLPDQHVEKVLGESIRPEALVVLCLSPLASVRAAALGLFHACCQRAARPRLSSILHLRLFTLLANQVHQHPATPSCLQAACLFLHEPPLPAARLPVFLALLETCPGRGRLLQDAVGLLSTWLREREGRMENAVEEGLCEVLLNTVHAVVRDGGAGEMEEMTAMMLMVADYLLVNATDQFEDLLRLLALLQHQQSSEEAENKVRTIIVEIAQQGLSRLLVSAGFDISTALDHRRLNDGLSVDQLQLFFNLVGDLAVLDRRNDHEVELLGEGRFLEQFHNVLFLLMTRIVRKPGSRVDSWDNQLWQIRDVLRLQYLRLLVHLCSPDQPFQRRLAIIRIVTDHEYGEQILNLSLSTSLGHVASFELLDYLEDASSGDFVYQEFERLRQWLQRRTRGSPRGEQQDWTALLSDQRQLLITKNERTLARWRSRLISWSEPLSKLATELSAEVDFEQKRSRKTLMMALRDRRAEENAARREWHRLVVSVCHPRGVWFETRCSPPAWELDPTENGCREHRRLKPAFMDNLPPSFFKEEAKSIPESSPKNSSVAFLLHRTAAFDLSVLHSSNEAAPKIEQCRLVAPTTDTTGILVICRHDMHFLNEEEDEEEKMDNHKYRISGPSLLTWRIDEIYKICRRRFELRDTAIEIFLITGCNYLLSLQTARRRDDLLEHLRSVLPPSKFSLATAAELQTRWIRGELTNFDYLMHLNTLAGRSYNDLMQYPVFPFVLADFTSDQLDLTLPTTFRNLAKPVSVQHKGSEQRFQEKFCMLERQYREMAEECDYICPPYHYSSHYSNSGTVLHYLLRLPSFTTVFIHYQDSHFDLPDRTFHSVATTWNLCSWQSESDVKEMIPEFFFLPEFLENGTGFNFGLRQNGLSVDKVILPSWSKQSARLFILIHRAALESPLVTANLSKWIDLIFGYKQFGKRAVREVNIYHPYTYYGAIDPDGIEDPVRRRAVQTMIRTYGQTPEQLFRGNTAHPLPSRVDEEDREAAVAGVPVTGLRWGAWLGSPQDGDPCASWTTQCEPSTAGFALWDGEMVGIAEGHCGMEGGIVQWSAADHVLRWRAAGPSQAVVNLHEVSLLSRVTTATFLVLPNSPGLLWLVLGFHSGLLRVYEMPLIGDRVNWKGQITVLNAHFSPISCLETSSAYRVLLSGDSDNNLCLWDVNSWSLLRVLVHDMAANVNATFAVTAVVVSPTLGDIAAIFNSINGCHSHLKVWTINGSVIDCRTYPANARAQCLTYSSLAEGRNINGLIVGLANGAVEVLSSWTLDLVRLIDVHRMVISASLNPGPVRALKFSPDCRRLYVAMKGGVVVCLDPEERKTLGTKSKPVHVFSC